MYYLLLTTYYLQRDRTDGRVYHPLLLREAVQRLAERRAPGECVGGGGGGGMGGGRESTWVVFLA